jgi:3-deoxy-D-manno-octulosonic-acid transferase
MPRSLYSLLLYCALPFVACWFLWKHRRDEDAQLAARLGLGLAQRDDHPVWLHAASVGEVRSLSILLRLLHRAGFALLLTVGTPTGLAHARQLYRDLAVPPRPGRRGLVLQAAPWDLPHAVRRFLRANQPHVGLFVETELWPNLLAAARRAQVPLGLASARLSERSLRRYLQWAPRLMRDTVQAFDGIVAQEEHDRERFVQLGALPAVVLVGGSLKSGFALPPEIDKLGAAWRAQWASRRPLWVAGSTHAGEEAICLAAQRRLLAVAREQGTTPPLLALAPRHPQRFDDVARQLAAAGFTFARSTQPPASQPEAAANEVLLIDEMGALLGWYAAGDAAFVGGSLVPVGGHNLLEPAMLGKPVLAGPHDANAPEVARRLRDAGGLIVVTGAGDLAAELALLFAEPLAARQRGSQASAGALPEQLGSRRALELLARLLAARSNPITVPRVPV